MGCALQGIGTLVNTYTSIYNGDATQIPKGSIGGYTQNNSAVPTVTAAIQTPNTFYYWQEPVSTSWTWYNFADISLWSDYSINKSIYDPCPYGYRVPNNGSWTGFPTTTWIVNIIDGGALWSNLWWPTGLRHSDSGALVNVGYGGYYWSSARYSKAYNSHYLIFDYAGLIIPSSANYRGWGFSVRCVQENAGHTNNKAFRCVLRYAQDDREKGCRTNIQNFLLPQTTHIHAPRSTKF